nr:MaoC/PaaZ C-terminal domain-containing protein [Hyphomonas sp. Mor2]
MQASKIAVPEFSTLEGEASVLSHRIAMAFAAGLLIDDARYYSERAANTPILPFINSRFEWACTSKIPNYFNFSETELRSGVHLRQDTEFHRGWTIGERIRTDTEFVSGKNSSLGAITVVKFTTKSLEDNSPITSTWSTALYRGVSLPCEDFELSPYAPLPPSNSRLEVVEEIAVPIHIAHIYSECADIWNPIHTEQDVAKAYGLQGIIVHGSILWALAGKGVVDAVAAGNQSRLKRFSGSFSAPVFPGSNLKLEITADRPVLNWQLSNAESGIVHVTGEAEFHN